MEGVEDENDDNNVVISEETFKKKSNSIITKMADYFNNLQNMNHATLEEIIRNHYGNNIEIHKINENEQYEAVSLRYFLSDLSDKIGASIETVDIYCIYTRLKYSDDFETIDFNKLVNNIQACCRNNNHTIKHDKDINNSPNNDKKNSQEVNNFQVSAGIDLEVNHKELINHNKNIDCNEEKDDGLFTNLSHYLKERNIKFDELINEFNEIIIVENNIKFMKYSDFISLMFDNSIISSKFLSGKTTSLISESSDLINLSNLKNIVNNINNSIPAEVGGVRGADKGENSGTVKIHDDTSKIKISKDAFESKESNSNSPVFKNNTNHHQGKVNSSIVKKKSSTHNSPKKKDDNNK